MDREVHHEIQDRMASMNTTIEDLEDTLVLLTQTLVPNTSLSNPDRAHSAPDLPSDAEEESFVAARAAPNPEVKHVAIEGENPKDGERDKRKETKSKHLSLKSATKRGKTKRSASQPDLLTTSPISLTSPVSPFSPPTQAIPASTTLTAKRPSKRTKSKSLYGEKTIRDAAGDEAGHTADDRKTQVVSIGKGKKGKEGSKTGSKEGEGVDWSHGQVHSHGHGAGHLLGHLFHRRPSSHKLKTPTPGLLAVPGESPSLSFGSPSRTPSSPAVRQVAPPSIITSRLVVSSTQTLLDDLSGSIADLRHQHSSLLTLYPLSSDRTAESSARLEGADGAEYHGMAETKRGAPGQERQKGLRVRSGSISSVGSDSTPSQQADTATLSRVEDNDQYFGKAIGVNAGTDTQNQQARRRHNNNRHHHAHRTRLSSMYAEVASIYYDAEVVLDAEEDDQAHPSAVREEGMKQALENYEAQQGSSALSSAPLFPTIPEPPRLPAIPRSAGPIVRRTALAAPTPAHEPSLMGMLRKNVGKDLSTISFDVTFNEPISLLQKLAEEVEYVNLLKLAAVAMDPIERIAHVAAFAVSQYANAKYRTSRKPFNPLMGETFELIRPELGMRFIAEKVKHQPPKLACHADGDGWTYWCTSSAKNKLAGMGLELLPTGSQYVELTARHERYTWSKPPSYMRNLVAGTRYVETIGDLVVVNESSGERCVVTFKEGGWGGGGRNTVSGICYTANGTKAAWISGIWDSHLDVRYGGPKDPSHPLWVATPWPIKPERNYGFTQWAIELNEPVDEEDLALVAPSDSRLRPDQQLLEEGLFTEADEMKKRLEEAQRTRRTMGGEHQSKWFQLSPGDGESWEYRGGYFESRAAQTLQSQSFDDLW